MAAPEPVTPTSKVTFSCALPNSSVSLLITPSMELEPANTSLPLSSPVWLPASEAPEEFPESGVEEVPVTS